MKPSLVAPGYRTAPTATGASYDDSFAAARDANWPGYLGAPRLATAELGQRIWTSFSAAALKTTLEVLGGTDPATYTRYLSYLVKMPLYQAWIRAAEERDRALGDKQRIWLEQRRTPR